MSVRTLEELADRLDKDLGWRKKEITSLAFAVTEAAHEYRGILLRASTAMLYAHWEGFVKNAAGWYLSYVAVRRLPTNELSVPFRALIYRKRLTGLQHLALGELVARVDALVAEAEQPCVMPEEGTINTRSNLNYGVFAEIAGTLGLEDGPYVTKRALIDQKLVYCRNNIAHGVELQVTDEEFMKLKEAVIDLIDTFCIHVYEAAAQRLFRQSSARP